MDDPIISRSGAVPDDPAEAQDGTDGHRVAHWHDGLGWQQMRPRIAEILTYVCVVDGCDYQLSRTSPE